MTARPPAFRLINRGWDGELLAARKAAPGSLRIVCPFIKRATLERLMGASGIDRLEVITRFDLNCFNQGVSDLEALKMVIDAGGRVRGVKGPHAKLYLFGSGTAIATSANVTDAAFLRNHEFGFIAGDPDVVGACHSYFDQLWSGAAKDLTRAQLSAWAKRLQDHQRQGGGPAGGPTLPDFGVAIAARNPFTAPDEALPPENQAFIKFFGRANDRTPRDAAVADVVAESGCNWACTYPMSKPPRQVEDGDLIYMARMVDDDMMIFGKAIGRRHRDDKDLASKAELRARPWKSGWPRHVRVHDAQFVNARLADGVSFYEMMTALKADSFASTQRHAREGGGNTDPFASYNRKAHMMLTPQSRDWIERRLDASLVHFGEVDLTSPRFRPPSA